MNSIDNKIITISKEKKFLKIEINDYISIFDYENEKKSNDTLDLLCNCVLWNSNKQKVNKGLYYIITMDSCIYNILLNEEKIIIDERIKKELDSETKKENIIQERVITFDENRNECDYYSAKHESNGNTYYTKYYNKKRMYSLGTLDLEEEQAYKEIKEVIYNLEEIEGINNILDIQFLKNNCFQKKKLHTL